MPIVKYRTLAARETQEAYNVLYSLFDHLAPYASELKALSVVGQPEQGYIVELSEAIPPSEVPHLGLELIG